MGEPVLAGEPVGEVAERPYRDPRTPDDALAELRRCTATQFDERVVDTVCTIVQTRELQRSAA